MIGILVIGILVIGRLVDWEQPCLLRLQAGLFTYENLCIHLPSPATLSIQNMAHTTLSEIWVDLIKSLGGIALEEAVAERRVLRYDRRWMMVDDMGRFVTQREIPTMALLGTAIEPPYLSVFWKSKPSEKVQIHLEIDASEFPNHRVEI